MSRDTGIADRLRAAGLRVVEVAGWQTRGSADFNPRGSVDHHTASGPAGNSPSLGVVISGRSDLPGPLCNVLQARDNTLYVVAAGRANHAGAGGWQGLSGNSTVYGIERENVGTPAEPWRPDQTFVAAAAHAALIRGCARPDAGLVCRHQEWAPTRKVDTHSIDGPAFRGLVNAALHPPAPAPPPAKPTTAIDEDDDDMVMIQTPGRPEVFATNFVTKSWIRSGDIIQFHQQLGALGGKNVGPFNVPASVLDTIPTVA